MHNMSSDYENSDNEYFEDDDEIMDDDGKLCGVDPGRGGRVLIKRRFRIRHGG